MYSQITFVFYAAEGRRKPFSICSSTVLLQNGVGARLVWYGYKMTIFIEESLLPDFKLVSDTLWRFS